MTLKEFINNPAGKGDSSVNRATLISVLDSKYDKLVKDKTIQFKIYKKIRGGSYYFHLIIPSETERDNTYDVVFLFEDPKKLHSKSSSISEYDIRVFANSPSFAYTFAKVYKDNDLFIDSLSGKYEKEILSLKPEVRNRYGIVNYDKYVYFGAKFIMESRLLNKASLSLRSITYSEKIFNARIRSLGTIMNEYQKAKKKLKNKKEPKTSLRQSQSLSKIKTPKTVNVKTPKAVKTPKQPKAKLPKTKKTISKKK